MERIEPFPLTFPRNIDLLPLLTYQRELDSNLLVNKFKGTASIALGATTRDVIQSREHDIRFVQNSGNRQKTDVEYDGGAFTNTISQEDLWNETMDYLGLVIPEITINHRLTIEPIPRSVESHEDLSGLNNICQFQLGIGNFTPSLKRRFGLANISNPYRLIKEDLMIRDLWRRPVSKYLRSVLRTDKILGIDGIQRGWIELFQIPRSNSDFAFPPLSSQLSRALNERKWWTDTGIPRRFLGRADGSIVEGTIYVLTKRGRIVAI